jgi:hypothetical protein
MIRVFLLATLGLYAVLASGCSSAGDSNPPMLAPSDPTMMATPTTPETCANHEQGCPCDKPDEVIDCGRVKRVAGDYVWCSTGTQTCSYEGTWGKCTGDTTATDTTTTAP